jgi:hypothetical protein
MQLLDHSTSISTTFTGGVVIGMDLGDRWSRFCMLDSVGTIQQEEGVRSTSLAGKRKLGRGPYHHGRSAEADWRDARISKPKLLDWKVLSAGSGRNWIFSRVPCEGTTRMPR